MSKNLTTRGLRLTRALLVPGLLLALSIGSSLAQESTATLDAETKRAMLQRLNDLELQVKELRAQLESSATPSASASASATASVTAPNHPPAPPQETMPGHDMGGSTSPRLQLRGYADVGWNTSDQKNSTNSFALGQFNLFISSRLTDKATFLAETVIEADPATNEFGIDLERMELIYAVNDHLNLQFGRYHTAMGFYNTAYHHSALMQTALGRPFLFDFEDHGGILPVHSVGMSATGTVSNKLGLHYIAEIGNGRSPRLDANPVQNLTDDNNGKAFNLGFFMRPDWARGLQFGFSNYHDHITPPGKPNITENILAGHIVYQNSRFEFLNEGVLMRHSIDKTSLTANVSGFYSQISKRFGNYRPYFRYEYVNVPASDPLFSDVGLIHGPKAGLRYDLNDFTALKFEYGREMHRALSSVNRFGTQLAFAF